MAKLEKKFLKNGYLPNFGAIKARLKFLIPNIKTIFNFLWLIFIKTLIFWHFDIKYHILIKINILGYVIGGILSKLTFETSSNRVVT